MACPNDCGRTCIVSANFLYPGPYFSSSPVARFDRVQMGEWCDCWFVAALSSYLFTNTLSVPLTANSNSNYAHLFFDYNSPVIINTDTYVCCTGKKQNPVIYGAKEIYNGITYSFPAVIEKAYVQFLQQISTNGYNNPPPMLTRYPPAPPPPYPCPTGNPLDCLWHLCGGSKEAFFTSDYYSNPSAIFWKIASLSNSLGDSQYVHVPFVAWTKYDTVSLGLKQQHSYSILGLVNDSEWGENIIVRDPDFGSCIAYTLNSDVRWTYIDERLPNLPPVTVNCGQNNGKGIFAIKVADFQKYFEVFGYVH